MAVDLILFASPDVMLASLVFTRESSYSISFTVREFGICILP